MAIALFAAAPAPSVALNRDQLRTQRVAELLSEGMKAYKTGDIEQAAKHWEEVLLIDPGNRRASVYLKEIQSELAQVRDVQQKQQAKLEAEADARRKMDEKITLEVKEGTSLRDFLNTLSFVSGINFVIVRGANIEVAAKFEDTPVDEILDAVLAPNGLTWQRKGDVITIQPELRTRVFALDSDTYLKVQRLYDANELQRILWGSERPPLGGIDLTLDDRQSALILTDSARNIETMRTFLAELRTGPTPGLQTRIYPVRKDIAKKVKVLVDTLLRVESNPPYEFGRRVMLAEGEDVTNLVIRDSEANLRRVEDLLQDRGFLRHIEEEEIDVYSANLTPRDVFTENKEQVEAFGRNVVEILETMLYHNEGVAAAREKGRRLWFDPPTLQLTITDYPANIRKAAEFIEALPQLEPKMRSKIIFLEHANAGELASQLEQVLGIAGAGAGAVDTGTQATFSLRVEDERTFRDLSIRLVRVDENVYGDDNDDSCELVVRTATAQSSDLSIEEYRSEVFEEYEIYVEEVDPSPTPGEGRVRIQVRYLPQFAPAPY
jgi:hypothetical protein